MKVIKVAGLTAVAYLSKLLVSLFIIKEISTIHGPAGLGLLGNFMTLVSLASTLAGGGMLSGMITYLGESLGRPLQQQRFTTSAFIYTIFFAIFPLSIGVCCIGGLTELIFFNQTYRVFIYFFLIAQVLVALNNYVFGVVIGLGKNSVYTLFLLIGNMFALIIAYFAIHRYGLWGSIVAIMAPTVLPIIPALFYACKQRWIQPIQLSSLVEDSRFLAKFTFMRLFSVLCFPLVEILVTNQIKSALGIESAGYWQAVMKLSLAYMTFFSMFLTFYFLPRLSTLRDKRQIIHEVKQMSYLIGAAFLVMFGIFMCFKVWIIQTVLSDQFLPMGDWIGLQMIGDLFRVLGWIMSFVAVSKAATKWYLLGEAFQGLLFMLLTTVSLFYFHDVQSVIGSYVMTCCLYCLFSIAIFVSYVNRRPRRYGEVQIDHAT